MPLALNKRNQWCVSRTGAQARDAVPKMGDGLPESAYRSRLQTARCCCVQKAWWWATEEKASAERCQVSIEEMSASKPSDDASLLPQDTAKTGVDHWPWDESGRYLLTDPMAVGV